MFIFLLLFSAFNLSSSAPITVTGSEYVPFTVLGRAIPDCINVARHRTMQDIVLSCLATIFACTWVAIHPNIPGPGDSSWMRLKRRVLAMTYALIAPEFTILWALRQRIAAGRIATEYSVETSVPWHRYLSVPYLLKTCWAGIQDAVKGLFEDPRSGKKWTLTHGFFIQMGGFILYDGETPLRVLRFVDLKEMIAKGEVDPPTISEQRINDRSRGDFLTKLIVVLQTTWFIFQCLARWGSNLPVTELEVVTLAFATLNIIAYALWWKKPQGVLVAVEVQLKAGITMEYQSRDELGGDGKEKDSDVIIDLRKDMKNGWFGRLIGAPWTLFTSIVRPIWKTVDLKFEKRSLRVPMYHAEAVNDKNLFLYPITAIGILFGGLHLIPWSSQFPTTTEQWLWRGSAIYITCFPIISILIDVANSRPSSCIQISVTLIGLLVYFSGIILYPLARLVLLALAFSTLRTQPQEAYLNIEWTTFIPHV